MSGGPVVHVPAEQWDALNDEVQQLRMIAVTTQATARLDREERDAAEATLARLTELHRQPAADIGFGPAMGAYEETRRILSIQGALNEQG